MGPNIILDKSAYQCLSKEDTFELSRYFFVVTPPVLIMEILADLKKPALEAEKAKVVVGHLARKIQPVDGIVNLDYKTLCTADLLGGNISLDRRAIVGRGKQLRHKDGSRFDFVDIQPENEALIRWSCGEFEQAEQLLATQWRHACKAIDLQAFQKRLRATISQTLKPSLNLVAQVVDDVLELPEAQWMAIDCLLRDIQTIPVVREWSKHRWQTGKFRMLKDFAIYAQHCIRTTFMFQQALAHQLIGTRSTNRIDMEYFYYAPFAHIFCSNDKLHATLAKVVLFQDQSFVSGDELRIALRAVGDARRRVSESQQSDPRHIQPPEDSLIRKLWIKHFGAWPEKPPGASEQLSDEEEKEILAKIAPFRDAMKRIENTRRPKWPCP